MAATCLKCGYARLASDSAPPEACPKCGAIYAKVEAAERAGRPVRPAVVAQRRTLPEPDYSRPFETTSNAPTAEAPSAGEVLMGERSADQTWSILALCCGGFSLFLPYFAVMFFAPVGVMLGLVAAHKRRILPGLLAVVMSAGALYYHSSRMSKLTAALEESSQRLQSLLPR